jgi:hypothetical protein
LAAGSGFFHRFSGYKPGAVGVVCEWIVKCFRRIYPVLESEFLFFGIPIDDVSVREYRTAKQINEV